MRSSKLSGLNINNPPLLRWSRIRAPIAQSQMKVATLNDATEWKLSLAISKGGGSSVDLAVRVKFSEDEVGVTMLSCRDVHAAFCSCCMSS